MYASICSADLAGLFCPLDLFTLLFSAICHDLDHPGLTNVYQVHARTYLLACLLTYLLVTALTFVPKITKARWPGTN